MSLTLLHPLVHIQLHLILSRLLLTRTTNKENKNVNLITKEKTRGKFIERKIILIGAKLILIPT